MAAYWRTQKVKLAAKLAYELEATWCWPIFT